MSVAPPAEESAFRTALRGARENLGPGLALQAFALALLLAYYKIPAVNEALAHFTVLRKEWGVIFPMITTAICGGVLPYLYLLIFGGDRRQTVAQALFLLVFWFYKGFEIDLLYKGLSMLFGEAVNVQTILAKMAFDQFFYNPLYAGPGSWVVYAIVAEHFDLKRVWSQIRSPGWYRRYILPVMISTWGVWIPTVLIIYALPTSLQLPMQNLVLCFFTLLIQTVALRKSSAHSQPAPSGGVPTATAVAEGEAVS